MGAASEGLGLVVGAAALPMVEKLRYVGPEMVMFAATVAVMVLGLSPSAALRRSCTPVSVLALLVAGGVALVAPVQTASALPGLMGFAKPLVAAVGVLLVLLLTGTVDREYEASVERGARFDAIRSTGGEFHAFMLFSLTGLMLCTTADDLIWLFLALELTSLPTYVMVSISTARTRSQEAGVKYFFLGALGAAMFLYGFSLLYGATGTTLLFGDARAGGAPGIAQVLARHAAETGGIGTMATLGLVISIVGVSFKIAAVPMHYYTPDVYEGAATSVAAFLAFVPKAAGFVTLILLASVAGWGFGPHGAGTGSGLPEALRVTLWVMAALTMTVGNVLALLQQSVKRILAYSSIAHSGYMLVGVVVGPGAGPLTGNGLAATLFYLLCYGFMNLGAFAVLASLERRARADGHAEEIETVEDLRGLCATHRGLGWTMVLSSLSLLGMPPLLGFFGKLLLFTSAISSGEITLVVVMGLNAAIAAFYYLRLAGVPLLEAAPEEGSGLRVTASGGRLVAGLLSAASVIALVPAAGWLMKASDRAGKYTAPDVAGAEKASKTPVAESAAAAE